MSNTTKSPRPVGRKRQIVASVTALAIVGGGVAYAAYSAQMSMSGNIGAGQFVALYGAMDGTIGIITEGGTTADEPVLGASGNRVHLPNGTTAYSTINLGTRELFPTENLTVEVVPVIQTQSGRVGFVKGLTGTLPSGWSAKIESGCGLPVNASKGSKAKITFTHSGATAPADLSNVKVLVEATTQLPNPAGVVCSQIPAAR